MLQIQPREIQQRKGNKLASDSYKVGSEVDDGSSLSDSLLLLKAPKFEIKPTPVDASMDSISPPSKVINHIPSSRMADDAMYDTTSNVSYSTFTFDPVLKKKIKYTMMVVLPRETIHGVVTRDRRSKKVLTSYTTFLSAGVASISIAIRYTECFAWTLHLNEGGVAVTTRRKLTD